MKAGTKVLIGTGVVFGILLIAGVVISIMNKMKKQPKQDGNGDSK